MNTMMTCSSRWVPIATLSLLLTAPDVTQAERWTTVGAAGTVDKDDLVLYKTDTSKGVMFFASGITGELNINYNIGAIDTFAYPEFEWLVGFRDNGASARVLLELKRYNIFSGITSTVTTFDSNSFGSSASFRANNKCFHHVFDFLNFAYFINARIIKTAADGKPALGAVQLGECIPG